MDSDKPTLVARIIFSYVIFRTGMLSQFVVPQTSLRLVNLPTRLAVERLTVDLFVVLQMFYTPCCLTTLITSIFIFGFLIMQMYLM